MRTTASFLAMLLFSIFTFSAVAQIDKGTFAAGVSGNLALGSKNLRVNFTPSVEYFPLKNLSLGYRQYSGLLLNQGDLSTKLRSEAYTRYYLKLSDRTYLFGEAGLAYGSNGFGRNESVRTIENLYSVYGVGMSWFATQRLAIEGRVYYERGFKANPVRPSGFNGQVGLKYYFGR